MQEQSYLVDGEGLHESRQPANGNHVWQQVRHIISIYVAKQAEHGQQPESASTKGDFLKYSLLRRACL